MAINICVHYVLTLGEGTLTHWGRVTHICVSNLSTIDSDNGLSPGRRQAIIQTNAGILSIEPLGRNFNEILIEIHIFSFKKIHFKMSYGKRRPFCLGLNVLNRAKCMFSFQMSFNSFIADGGNVACECKWLLIKIANFRCKSHHFPTEADHAMATSDLRSPA